MNRKFFTFLAALALVAGLFASLPSSPARAAALPPAYYPLGPQINVPVSSLVGWELCWISTYDTTTSVTSILADCSGDYLLLGGKPTGSSVITVLAAAPRADVLFVTAPANDGITHNANGTGWYFNDSWSWGFAKEGDPVTKQQCDVDFSTNSDLRLCWHTIQTPGSVSPGYRAGNAQSFGTDYERFIYQPISCTSAITVTSGADSGAGTLRQALADVCTGGTIDFNNNFTISLASTLTVDKDVTISDMNYRVTLDGQNTVRVMRVNSGVALSIDNFTIQNGLADNLPVFGEIGGGIFNEGTLNVTKSTFVNNHAPYGGGAIYSAGTTSVTNSTFSGNSTTNPVSGGGAIAIFSGSTTVTNSTFSGNSSANGGGILNQATATLYNTIVTNSPTGGDCSGTFTANSFNLDSDGTCGNATTSASINLGMLINHGGPTDTFDLLTGSSAINAADNTVCPLNDQTGLPRLNGDGGFGGIYCDVGAFEAWDDVAPTASIDTFPSNPSATSAADFTFSATDDFTIAPYFYFWCKMDAGIWEPCNSGAMSYLDLSNGSHTFYVDAYDEVGNVNSTFYTWTVNAVPAPLPSPWIGGISISSDKNVVAVARPHVGAEVASYNGSSTGSLLAYLPMLFKDAYGGSYDSAFYIQNVDPLNTANMTIYFYNSAGTLSCTITDTVSALASKGYWVPGLACLPAGWVGGVTVVSDQPVVAIGRPHIGAEVMTYNGFATGSARSYIPMLFKDAFGGSYDAAFYVQNVDNALTGNIIIEFYDNTGALSCTITDTILPLASKGYWVPGQTCLPAGWVGGVVVYSDTNIVAVGRPHIGSQITTYTGVAQGGLTSYVPMLFKGAFGGTYNSAVYVQNNDPAITANLTFDFYDSDGNLVCTGTGTLAPWAVVGYWIPGTACLPAGWAGGVVITSNVEIVAVGRPHVGSQVTTYNGVTSGNLNSYLPMLFKAAYGGSYNSAFYIQNTEASAAAVTIRYYDSTGALTCSRHDTIPALATLGLWVPSLNCTP